MEYVPRSEKGFSLIELLVAISLLTIGMLGVGTMLSTSSRTAKFSNQTRSGDTIALELIDNLKARATLIDKWSGFETIKLASLVPGSTTKYEYKDADSSTSGTVSDGSGGSHDYLERLGVGQGYKYKWRVEDLSKHYAKDLAPSAGNVAKQDDALGIFKIEINVGWSYCEGDDPSTCRYKSRITNYSVYNRNRSVTP